MTPPTTAKPAGTTISTPPAQTAAPAAPPASDSSDPKSDDDMQGLGGVGEAVTTTPLSKKLELTPPSALQTNPIFAPDLSHFTLRPKGGPVFADFSNQNGLDHGGPFFGLQAGPRFILGQTGRHSINLMADFNYQWLQSDLGEGVASQGQVWSLGLAADYLYQLHPQYFSFGPQVSAGVAHFGATQGNGFDPNTLTVDDQGIQYNSNPQLEGMDAYGFQFTAGLKLCTLGEGVCAGIEGFWVPGLNPRPADGYVDEAQGSNGQYPVAGFSPSGLRIPITVDPLRIYQFFRPTSRPISSVPPQDNPQPVPHQPDSTPPAGTRPTPAPSSPSAPTGPASTSPAGQANPPASAAPKKTSVEIAVEVIKNAQESITKAKSEVEDDARKAGGLAIADEQKQTKLKIDSIISENNNVVKQLKGARDALELLKATANSKDNPAEAKEAKKALNDAQVKVNKMIADAKAVYSVAQRARDTYIQIANKKNPKWIISLAPLVDPMKATDPVKANAPAAKPGAPAAKPGAPAAKPGAPAAKPGAPAAKPGAPAAKPGAPAAKPGAPAAKPDPDSL